MAGFLRKLSQKFLPGDDTARTGIVWNVASFAVIGVSGILMNTLIGLFYTPNVLGVFNQVLSFYIVFGQVGAWGLHNAAIYFLPRQQTAKDKGALLTSFLLLCTLAALVCAGLLVVTAAPLGRFVFHSKALAPGLLCAAPAVFLFAINKVLLGFINALRCMRAFAVFQGLRYLVIILFVVFAAVVGLPGTTLPWALLVSEAVVFTCAAIFLFRQLRPALPRRAILRQGFQFGAKSMAGGVVGELNTKVDILMLGIFSTDSVVGIYSYAAMLAEGFASLIVVFRNNLNPVYAQMLYKKEYETFTDLNRQVREKVLPLCATGAAAILLGYWVLTLLLPDSSYQQAILPLAVILLCMIVASVSMVKGNVLTQMGRPELDTLVTVLALLANIVFNLALIPALGMLGAGIATGVSYLFLAGAIQVLLRKHLKTL